MTDDELLIKYKNYKKKRTIIIIIITLLFSLSIFIVLKFPKQNESIISTDSQEQIEESEDTKQEDNVNPVLELIQETDEIEIGRVFFYIMLLLIYVFIY